MLSIEQIENNYSLHSDHFSHILQQLKNDGIEIEFPISNDVFMIMSNNIDSTFRTMIMAGKTNNLFASFALYRLLLEQFYRGFYLADILSKEKTDVTSEHFKVHYFLSEFLAEQLGYLDMEDLISEASKKTDFVKFIRSKFPELEEFDKSNQQEISEATKKFSLKEIVKYLHDSFGNNKGNKLLADFFTWVLPEYSKYSTFVHGGAYSSEIITRIKDKNQEQNELERILGISLTSACILKENILLTYKLGSEATFNYLLELRKLREKQ